MDGTSAALAGGGGGAGVTAILARDGPRSLEPESIANSEADQEQTDRRQHALQQGKDLDAERDRCKVTEQRLDACVRACAGVEDPAMSSRPRATTFVSSRLGRWTTARAGPPCAIRRTSSARPSSGTPDGRSSA